MIFDGLPILSAGGGTKISGPYLYEFFGNSSTEHTLRLEGQGVLTFFGKWDSNNYTYLSVPILGRSGNSNMQSLEIDGETYTMRQTSSSSNLIVGGKVNAPKWLNITTVTGGMSVPINYIFYEYLEIKCKTSGNYAFEYYDLDADNPVTVTYA